LLSGSLATRGIREKDEVTKARRLYDTQRHAHFVTFSCYKRRRLLDADRAKRIVLGVLNSQLANQGGACAGFVIMPDHVHAIVWFDADNQVSGFMKQWKRRTSIEIKRLLKDGLVAYGKTIDPADPVWQAGFYDFNIYEDATLREKLEYEQHRSVGVPLRWLD
jgi:putative transposase